MGWAVIGAGPCGIGAVGKLVDAGLHVVWIDSNFNDIGRMGRSYRDVPANTPNGSLWDALFSCSSFQMDKYLTFNTQRGSRTLGDLNRSECSQLSFLVDALDHASLTLRSHPLVTPITGFVESMTFSHHWNICLSSQEDCPLIEADTVILAVGAVPVLPPNLPPGTPCHDLDLIINSKSAREYFSRHPELLSLPWAVVGSSHRYDLRHTPSSDRLSAMLVLKNLVEVGVHYIINFYRSEFIFEELTEEGWYRCAPPTLASHLRTGIVAVD
jgi:hypothetical protein